LALIVAFLVAEVIVGILANSLALLSDAAHMLTDAASIGLALVAMRLSALPARGIFTYGLRRTEILSAQANGLTLLLLSVWLTYEAVTRLVDPGPVAGGLVLITAGVGIVVNLTAAWAISKANRSSLNIEGAFQHILTDLYGIAATAAAGAVILATGWNRADPIATLVVVILVARAAWGLLKGSGHILLEGTPDSVDLDEVRRHLHELPEVVAVHDLHAWTLTSDLPVLSAHVVVTDGCLQDGSSGIVLDHLQKCLADHFDVEHSTFQLEAAQHAEHERPTHD
jgi:cobalt-zinc-cadmium efflux system protein